MSSLHRPAPSNANAIRAELLRRTPPHRVAHVMGVEGMAVALAKRWDSDPERALLAAVLHDLAKPLPRPEQGEMMRATTAVSWTAHDERFPECWHGIAAAHEAATRYHITDPEVLEAVAWHSTGGRDFPTVGLIVYVSDFTEPSRMWDGVSHARQEILSQPTPHAAARVVARLKAERLATRGKEVHPRGLDMLEWLESHP